MGFVGRKVCGVLSTNSVFPYGCPYLTKLLTFDKFLALGKRAAILVQSLGLRLAVELPTPTFESAPQKACCKGMSTGPARTICRRGRV